MARYLAEVDFACSRDVCRLVNKAWHAYDLATPYDSFYQQSVVLTHGLLLYSPSPSTSFTLSIFIMSSQEDLDYTRQGLLKENSIPLRPSVDQAFRSSSELGSEYDELHFDQDQETKFRNGKRWPWIAKFRRIISGSGPAYDEGEGRRVQRPSRRSKIRAICWRWRICLIITGILLTGIIVFLSGSALWIYKTAPEDGVRSLITTGERSLY